VNNTGTKKGSIVK